MIDTTMIGIMSGDVNGGYYTNAMQGKSFNQRGSCYRWSPFDTVKLLS